MKNQDNLGKFLKELPIERPSDNFTRLVMDRVMLERKESPVAYQPIIARRIWLKFSVAILLVIVGSILLRSYFPANDQSTIFQSLSQIDLSFVNKPFHLISNAMKTLSPTFVTGLAAISLLILIDQVYSSFVKR